MDLKSAKRIEGSEALAFLRKRNAEMLSGMGDAPEFIEHEGRASMVKRIPTGFIQPKISVTPVQAQMWAKEVGLDWLPEFEQPELRVIPWRASDERVDRHGDIMRQNFDYTNFKQNPLLLECHEWEEPPIGNVIHWETQTISDQTYSGPATFFWNLFATFDMSEEADSLYRLARAKLLRAGSVGVYPQIIVYVEDPQERAAIGLGRWGVVYEKSEMVEFSICSVPANPGAVQNAVRRAFAQKTIKSGDRDAFVKVLESGSRMYRDPDEHDAVLDAAISTFEEHETRTVVALSEKRIDDLAKQMDELKAALTGMAQAVTATASTLRDGLLSVYENQELMLSSASEAIEGTKRRYDPNTDADPAEALADAIADLNIGESSTESDDSEDIG